MNGSSSSTGSGQSGGRTPHVEGYRIEGVLGRGGMGVVYLARDLALDRRVALKILPQVLVADPQSVERFRREARALARIHHPGVVPVHAIGESGDILWFAMRFVEGEPLSDTIAAAILGEKSRFSDLLATPFEHGGGGRIAAARSIGMELAAALHEVHEHGLVHRDVKPANVLLDERARPVLVDFGIACDPNASRLTTDDASPGTIRFMPPEQFGDAAALVDPRADVYALGATLYEVLTLVAAFGHDDLGCLIDAICHGRFERPRSIEPAIPRAFEDIVMCAMERDPKRRFQSAEDMREALAELEVGHGPGAARRPRARAPGGTLGIAAAVCTAVIGLAATAALVLPHRDADRPEADVAGSSASASEAASEATEGVDTVARPTRGAHRADAPENEAEPGDGRPLLDRDGTPGSFVPPGIESDLHLPVSLRKLLEHAPDTPLAEAARRLIDGDRAGCRELLRQVARPSNPREAKVFWQLVRIAGDPAEQRVAEEHLSRDAVEFKRGCPRPRPGRRD